MFRLMIILTLCYVTSCDRVYNKNCEGDWSSCQVSAVDVENCSHAPRFCRVTGDKRYSTTVTFVPNFTASKMMMTTGVVRDDGYITSRTYKRLCEDHMLFCPMEAQVKQKLQFEFTIDDDFSGTYPTRVQFWNTDNATEACCFTFRVKSAGRLQK